MKLLLVVLALVGACLAEKTRYDGHRVVYVPWATPAQIEALEEANLDIWATHPAVGAHYVGLGFGVDVMINDDTESILQKLGLTYTVKIPDVQANIDREEREQAEAIAKESSVLDDAWYTSYKNYTDIVNYMRTLCGQYTALCTFVASIGTSIEGRAIPALIIRDSRVTTVNRYFHFLGGQHAREWVGPATTLYVTEQLLARSNEADVRGILNRAAFYVAPMLNPDGYTFSWTSTRLWRKNRRANTGGSFGVDLNRNWDDGNWGGGGSSGTPSSDTYRGTAAFSEPESRAVAAWVNAQSFKFSAAIDFHSYSQLILRPAGWTNTPTVNETVLSTVGTGIRSAILGVNNVGYTSQRSFQLYQTTGTSTDYWYYKSGIVFSFCIELRDTGTYGFQLPPAQILPTGRENWAGVKYMVTYILANF